MTAPEFNNLKDIVSGSCCYWWMFTNNLLSRGCAAAQCRAAGPRDNGLAQTSLSGQIRPQTPPVDTARSRPDNAVTLPEDDMLDLTRVLDHASIPELPNP